jgi:hypothetical protein
MTWWEGYFLQTYYSYFSEYLPYLLGLFNNKNQGFLCTNPHTHISQTWGCCMDFSNQWRGYGFLSGFPPVSFTVYSNWTPETVRGCVSVKNRISSGKAVELTVNSKEENSEYFCPDFVQELGLRGMVAASCIEHAVRSVVVHVFPFLRQWL